MKRNLDFALAIFTGAFLLFLVQPLIGKYILPWFGGGPGVWTTCLLFFQAMLLAGYTYAHLTSRWLPPRAQVAVHLGLLAVALVLLPITPAEAGKPSGDANPTGQILWLLTVSLGLPYFVLSATGPLLQQWFCRANPGVSPYRLYALSNAGSLLALVSYPFWVETHFTRAAQAGGWSAGLALFALFCGVCARRVWRVSGGNGPRAAARPAPEDSPSPGLGQCSLWLLLPACASALLLATTNQMCQDVAVIPFLWVLPLALYLLSFILCFDSPRWYQRGLFTVALIAGCAALVWVLCAGTDAPIRWQVGIYAAGLLVCCMVCHGELYRLRPGPRQLTSFYLMIAAGGALGGVSVAVVAPLVFSGFYELHWALWLCAALFLGVWIRESVGVPAGGGRWLAWSLTVIGGVGGHWLLGWLGREFPALSGRWWLGARIGWWCLLLVLVGVVVVRWRRGKLLNARWVAAGWMLVGTLVLGAALWHQAYAERAEVVFRVRNFYGTLSFCEYQKDDPASHYRLLQHGRITHGLQFVSAEASAWRTTYYNEASGVGLAVAALPSGPRRMGLIGLGTGTLAAYGRAGDYLRIYEINPAVRELALSRFTYVSNSAAQVEIVLGDARLSLEREAPQRFDLLALDAFSGDAVPAHLLTREAFAIYERHLATNGVMAVHVSNQYLDLETVVLNAARHGGYQAAVISFSEDYFAEEDGQGGGWWQYASTWVLLTREGTRLDSPEIRRATDAVKTNRVSVPLWTDDFASLYQILE
jgi:spermidine synthase